MEDAELSLMCPITNVRLVDPVVDPEGNTYEKSAILDWLRRNPVSPITRSPLRPEDLVPNRALAHLLQASAQSSLDAAAPATAASNPPPMPAIAATVAADVAKLTLAPVVEAPPYTVEVTATHNSRGTTHISIEVISDSKDCTHSPSTIVCVIDISYSMDDRATMFSDQEGSTGLSLLDIVKHATHTIIESLSPHDMFGVVAYATEAKVVFPIRTMTPENRALAWERVNALRTDGQTNLWAGLESAMSMCQTIGHPKSSIMLLTDGLPNIEPPRGHRATLSKYLKELNGPCFEISTFGFGYRLASSLLRDIAALGRGTYSFIPDSSFVGTCFVNAAANVLAAAVPHAVLELKAINRAQMEGPLCEVINTRTPTGLSRQRKDILVRLKMGQDVSQSPVRAILNSISGGGQEIPAAATSSLIVEGSAADVALREQHARLLAVNLISDNEKRVAAASDEEGKRAALQVAEAERENVLRQIKLLFPDDSAQTEMVKGLVADIEGQMKEAYSRQEWHARWGCHFLPSLARSHSLQVCTNFKDPGLQLYSGPKFSAIRDYAEDIFIKLPPPTPSLARGRAAGPISMSAYHNPNNPCFASGMVLLEDGGMKDVAEVRAGDRVATGGAAKAAVVKCVVATRCAGGLAELVTLPGPVAVTKHHPLRQRGAHQWQFPCDLAPAKVAACQKVYSFVLEPPGAGAMVIGGYECVTLAHGMAGPTIGHSYLGTQRVLSDLSHMAGWSEGLVVLQPNPAIRDPVSGLIVGLQQNSGVPEALQTLNSCGSACSTVPAVLLPAPAVPDVLFSTALELRDDVIRQTGQGQPGSQFKDGGGIRPPVATERSLMMAAAAASVEYHRSDLGRLAAASGSGEE
eukprot:CAMPEP_0117680098 /NCGR_PEP_ID=MMETSP0804-20121206/18158_1 /TAXON_ID=1074897 /ORGANISM="Tetraselmis astigmatica, Strain CCMP880" /LENGTH=861 /DNA_ID=CAMNT_0005489547 /DNA_START=86 /DNA_END=2672 /DNA_ORIENTATION=+